jgi:hypothetical protein
MAANPLVRPIDARRTGGIGVTNPWLKANLPAGPAAILAALHMRDPQPDALATLSDADWRLGMEFADQSSLTLILRREAAAFLPPELRDRTTVDAGKNRHRLRRTEGLYRSLDERLRSAGIEYLALKGLTQCPEFGTPAELRVQFDVDLFVPPEEVERAGQLAQGLGFVPIQAMEGKPTDHLPTLIQKDGWEWRGDYFDPELPLSVELHFQFWSPAVERLAVPDVENFWSRRTVRRVAGIDMPVLAPADGLGYTALHLLRHILRGSARPFHIYEMAGFLDRHAADRIFWREWRHLHSPGFRRLQAVVFRLAAEWFGCEMGPVAEEEVAQLSAATRVWFDEFALSPARGIFYPHKDELWLHWSLLDSWRDKLGAARLRLLPVTAPGPVDAVHIPASEMTLRRRFLRFRRYAAYVWSRARRHVAAFPRALHMGLRWWWKTRRL